MAFNIRRYVLPTMGIMAFIMCTINLNMLRVRHKRDETDGIFLTHFYLNFSSPDKSTNKLLRDGSGEHFLRETSTESVHELEPDSNTFWENTLTAMHSNSSKKQLSYKQTNKQTSGSTNITTLTQARNYKLTPLGSNSIHTSYYTIRMNTWRRNDQLLLSINHHAKCEGVAKIQIIWCDSENEPPEEVSNHVSGKVIIERHTINSLNERYKILSPTPTLGILSLDDDVLRPCEALDATFIRWTRHPERIVGFNARLYVSNWTYSFDKVMALNEYSITLPSKAGMIHRDYLDLYISTIPRNISQHIDVNFNCEDIAMSYFVSTLTGGRPPLLSDHWAVGTQLQLHSSNELSWMDHHMV